MSIDETPPGWAGGVIRGSIGERMQSMLALLKKAYDATDDNGDMQVVTCAGYCPGDGRHTLTVRFDEDVDNDDCVSFFSDEIPHVVSILRKCPETPVTYVITQVAEGLERAYDETERLHASGLVRKSLN